MLCVQNTTNSQTDSSFMLQSIWATPCDGNNECLYNEDEINCNSPVWLLPIILLAMGLLLFGTLFCYLNKETVKDLEKISHFKPLENQVAMNVVCRLKKKFQLAVLIEKEECALIKIIVKEEINCHGSEESAMCCLKVLNKIII